MNTTYAGLRLEKREHIAVITLNNPPAHTWTAEGLGALTQLVKDLDADRSLYALVITGDGEKFFSAGADLKLFADGDKGVATTMARRFGEAFETLAAFRGVTIDPGQPGPRRAGPEPQLPGLLAAGVRATRRRPVPDQRA